MHAFLIGFLSVWERIEVRGNAGGWAEDRKVVDGRWHAPST